MNTVRLARELGSVRELLPDGIDSVTDLPYILFNAIQRGLTYLSFEELQAEDQPPHRIWDKPEKLEEWFIEVKRKRDRDSKGETVEDSVKNGAAKALISE